MNALAFITNLFEIRAQNIIADMIGLSNKTLYLLTLK